MRGSYRPLHIFFGICMIGSATATALVGITEEALLNFPDAYPSMPVKGVLLNCIGLLLTVFTITIIFISTKTSFKQLD